MIAATLDPDGRRVVLDGKGWSHIQGRHPQLAPSLREIMAAVREPDRRMPGRVPNEEWLIAEEIRPGRWLHVVVHLRRR